MKQNIFPLLSAFLISFCLLYCGGCTSLSHDDVSSRESQILDEDENAATEKTDTSCSYFYFLWGVHAENNQRFSEAEEAFEKSLICDPDSSYVLRRLPILLIRMGKPYGAAKWLRLAIEKYPLDLQDRLLLASLSIRNGDIEDAIDLYKEVIELSPDDETILLRLGFLYAQQNLRSLYGKGQRYCRSVQYLSRTGQNGSN